jgi:hypothetical protein
MDFDEERDQLLKAIAQQTDAMRELLSYCRAEAGDDLIKFDHEHAYNDVANKLAAILDGEQ